MRPPRSSTPLSIMASRIIGTVVVSPSGDIEGAINEVVIDSASGKVAYFVVKDHGTDNGPPSLFALPYGAFEFNEDHSECVASALYPLRL